MWKALPGGIIPVLLCTVVQLEGRSVTSGAGGRILGLQLYTSECLVHRPVRSHESYNGIPLRGKVQLPIQVVVQLRRDGHVSLLGLDVVGRAKHHRRGLPNCERERHRVAGPLERAEDSP